MYRASSASSIILRERMRTSAVLPSAASHSTVRTLTRRRSAVSAMVSSVGIAIGGLILPLLGGTA